MGTKLESLPEEEAATVGFAAGMPASLVAALMVDDDGRCSEASATACRLFGRRRADLLGASLEELLAPRMRDRFDAVWRAFRRGGGHAGPFELTADADPRSVDISVTANVSAGRHLLLISPTEPASRVGTDEVGAPAGPTAREREVLVLLAEGATDEQIAAALRLSRATVQTHVRNAKAKLGARTRAQAVAQALARGLIQAPVKAL